MTSVPSWTGDRPGMQGKELRTAAADIIMRNYNHLLPLTCFEAEYHLKQFTEGEHLEQERSSQLGIGASQGRGGDGEEDLEAAENASKTLCTIFGC